MNRHGIAETAYIYLCKPIVIFGFDILVFLNVEANVKRDEYNQESDVTYVQLYLL